MMPERGGALITLTFGGSMRVMPNYNVMGVAKAALEASVRYLSSDFGSRGIRVNAISAGPIRTLAGSGIGDARAMFAFQQKHSPLGRGGTLDELGGAALYSLSDQSGGVKRNSSSIQLQHHLDAAAGGFEGGVVVAGVAAPGALTTSRHTSQSGYPGSPRLSTTTARPGALGRPVKPGDHISCVGRRSPL
jgi:NAD(P)-dependent dehydrogenase (short-subunit alcohol dehydrogenase family)